MTVHEHKEPIWYGRLLSAGLAACTADIATHPIETLKVRLQVKGERLGFQAHHLPQSGGNVTHQTSSVRSTARIPITHTIRTILREEGKLALYNGLTAALQRQVVYASIRIGVYDPVKNFCFSLSKQEGEDVNPFNIGLRIMAATITCSSAITLTQPMDVVKLRMQAMRTDSNSRRRYTNSLGAYRDIYKHEGVKGLWKGTLPNMTRNSMVSVCELVTYDVFKTWALKHGWMKDTIGCHFVSAFVAGLCATIVCSPVDVVKTRIMNSGNGVYRGTFHCARVMWKDEGFTSFYKGGLPFYLRLGSWNIVMFVCYEQFKRLTVHFGHTA